MWLEVEGFSDLVKSFWGKLKGFGSRSSISAKKLNFLKLRLKEWNNEIFGHLDSNRADLVDKFKSFDEREQQLSLSVGDRIERL